MPQYSTAQSSVTGLERVKPDQAGAQSHALPLADDPATDQVHQQLLTNRLFGSLDADTLKHIASELRIKTFRSGEAIVRTRDDARSVYFVLRGRVRSKVATHTGRAVDYDDLSAGDVFGELGVIDGLPRISDVVAVEPSIVGSISKVRFYALLEAHREIGAAVLAWLAHRVRTLTTRIYEYHALPVEHRVISELLRIPGTHEGDIKTIDRCPTHSDIANRVNTHREGVARVFSTLQKAELLDRNQQTVRLLSVDELRERIRDDSMGESARPVARALKRCR